MIRITDTIGLNISEYHEHVLPLVVLYDRLREQMLDRNVHIVLPLDVAKGLTRVNHLPVIHADVARGMLAIEPER